MKKWLIALSVVLSIVAFSSHTEAQRTAGFEDLTEQLLPTVVNISTLTEVEQPNIPEMFLDFGTNNPLNELFKQFEKHYGQQNQRPHKARSLGSGFVIDAKKGYIVTNNHVIEDADEIEVIFDDNTNVQAEVIGTDKKTDIAILKIETNKKLQAAEWGNSDNLRIGEWVLAIGNPFGFGGTVTAGIVSARQRNIHAGPYDDFIQTDASINRGNSGGPMFNTNGKVVGVNTAIFSPMGGSVGIGFAIPSNMAKDVAEQLIKYGKTKRGWLGVNIQKVTPEIAESIVLDKARGAMVAGVTEDGPADKAGFKTGDVILAFDGQNIDEMHELPRLVASTEVGKKVQTTVWRNGKEKTLTVKLGQLEKAEEEGLIRNIASKGEENSLKGVEVKELGIHVARINDATRSKYSITVQEGMVITQVDPKSEAAEKGLRPGDVIVEAGQQDIKKVDALRSAIKAAKKKEQASLLLLINHQGDNRFVAVKLKQ